MRYFLNKVTRLFTFLALTSALQASEFNPKDVLGFSRIHELGITGNGVRVAIMEADVADHPLLRGKVVNPEDGRSNCVRHLEGVLSPADLEKVRGQIEPDKKHGSSVAGIIAGQGSPQDHFGVAPGAELVLANNLGRDITELQIKPATPIEDFSLFFKVDAKNPLTLNIVARNKFRQPFGRAIARKARLVNWSGTIETHHASTEEMVKIFRPYFLDLVSHDILIVISAGNESALLSSENYCPTLGHSVIGWPMAFGDRDPGFFSGFKKAINIIASDPKAKGRILFVGATAGESYPTFCPATFSNTGSRFEPDTWTNLVFAPGQNVQSIQTKDRIGPDSGTSMAAPFVSGLAALLFERHPTAPAEVIGEWIKSGCYRNSLSMGAMGQGVINAWSSFQIAERDCKPRISLAALCLESEFTRFDRAAHIKQRFGLELKDLKPTSVNSYFEKISRLSSLPTYLFFSTLLNANPRRIPLEGSLEDAIAMERTIHKNTLFPSFILIREDYSDEFYDNTELSPNLEDDIWGKSSSKITHDEAPRSVSLGDLDKGFWLKSKSLKSQQKCSSLDAEVIKYLRARVILEDVHLSFEARLESLEQSYPILENKGTWRMILPALRAQMGKGMIEYPGFQTDPLPAVLINMANRVSPKFYAVISLLYPAEFLDHLESLTVAPVELSKALDLYVIVAKTQIFDSDYGDQCLAILFNSLDSISKSDPHTLVRNTVGVLNNYWRMMNLDCLSQNILMLLTTCEPYWRRAFADANFEVLAHEKDKILRMVKYLCNVHPYLRQFWQREIDQHFPPTPMQAPDANLD